MLDHVDSILYNKHILLGAHVPFGQAAGLLHCLHQSLKQLAGAGSPILLLRPACRHLTALHLQPEHRGPGIPPRLPFLPLCTVLQAARTLRLSALHLPAMPCWCCSITAEMNFRASDRFQSHCKWQGPFVEHRQLCGYASGHQTVFNK